MSVGRLRVLVLSDPVVQFPVFVFVMEAACNDHNPSVIRKYKDDTKIQVPHTDNIDDLLKAFRTPCVSYNGQNVPLGAASVNVIMDLCLVLYRIVTDASSVCRNRIMVMTIG